MLGCIEPMDIPQYQRECQDPAFLLMHGWLGWVGWGTVEGIGVRLVCGLEVGVGAGAMCVAGRAAAVVDGSSMAAFARIEAVASVVDGWSDIMGRPSETV